MNKKELLTVLGTLRRGSFVRVGYTIDISEHLSANCRSVFRVEKTAVGTFRYGVDWRNTKTYIAREAARTEPKRVYHSQMEWVYPNVLKQHAVTRREYLALANATRNNAKAEYFVTNLMEGTAVRVDAGQLKAMGIMRPSYFNRKVGDGVSLPIENISYIKVGKKTYGKMI